MSSPAAAQTIDPNSGPNESHLISVQDGEGRYAREFPDDAQQRGEQLCAQLEAGNILLFPKTPFEISAAERAVLIGQKQTSAAYNKNEANGPPEDRVTGLDKSDAAENDHFRQMLRHFSQSAKNLL